MTAGVQVFGTANNIQVDSDWINFALVAVSSISSTSQTNYAPIYNGATLSTGLLEGDLVCAYCTSELSIIGFRLINGVRSFAVATFTTGVLVTFYVFRRQAPVSSGFGMQVFTAAGDLAFDAASKFVRVAAVIPASDIYLAKDYVIGNGKYGVLVPVFCGQIVQNWYQGGAGGQFPWIQDMSVYSPALQIISGGMRTTGQKVIANAQIPDTTGRPAQVTAANPVQILIADVTGF